jgi:GNAT superfamily N-acetyltransferase
MLARCSRGALLARFHGGASGEDYFRRVVGSDQAAVVAAWDGDRCVGTAELVAAPDGSRHLGVLVEDDRQRQGVGTVLVQMLASLARAHGWRWFVADVDAEDRFAVARLRAVGRTTVTRAGTDVRVRVDL